MPNNYLVIGGGTFGLSTAHALKLRGHQVTIFDRFSIPAEDAASNDINKVVRPDYGGDVLYQDLTLKAIEKFKQWNSDSIKRFGRPLYVECGAAFLTATLDMNEFERDCIKNLTKAGKADRISLFTQNNSTVPPEKLPNLEVARKRLKGGYFNAGAGFGDSGLTIRYLAELAREAGVRFLDGGAKGTFKQFLFEEGSKRRVLGIETMDGTRHHGTVIVAAGSWTPSLIPEFGEICTAVGQAVVQFDLKNHPELRKKFSPANFPVWFADVTHSGYYGFPANYEGIVKVANHGAGFPSVGKDGFHYSAGRTSATPPEIPVEAVLAYREFFAATFPELNSLPIYKTRICWYCDAWDSNFVVDRVPSMPDVFVASGGSGHGFKFTPVLGDVIADIVEGSQERREYRELFRWKERPQGTRIKDSIRGGGDEEKAEGTELHLQELCRPEDLTAEAYASGRLRERVRAAAQARAKVIPKL
ncbi:hypothetical protein HDU96_007843 [Phlyctochytrium bullatum]|nr:hypothetical protein HDU96_007843 [Phlyctochytrium bullatum]